MPFAHLAFDDARVGASLAGGVEASREFGDGSPPAVFSGLRGKIALLGYGAGNDAECFHEADPVRVHVGVVGGFRHEGADGVVTAQVAPDLLEYKVRGFRAQHGAGSTLVGFEFIESEFDLPALGVAPARSRAEAWAC